MKYCLLFFSILFCACSVSLAQPKADSLAMTKKDSIKYNDSIRVDKLFAGASHPLIKNSKWSGVLPVTGVDEKPDATMKYKILVEVAAFKKDSASVREVCADLSEAGRIMNLHIAAGIPKENLEMIILAHGPVLNAFLTNENYKKKFQTDNPNMDIIKQFDNNHVKFIACGQAMQYFDFPRETLQPLVKVALSAKTTLSTYLSKGFVLFNATE